MTDLQNKQNSDLFSAAVSVRPWPILLGLVCLMVIGYHFYGHQDEWRLVLNLDGKSLLGVSLLIFLSHLTAGYKIYQLVAVIHLERLNFGVWFRIFSVSRFLNFHIPQGGNIYRTLMLKQHSLPYSASLSLILMSWWYETAFSLLMAAVVVFWSEPTLQVSRIPVLPGMVLMFLGILLIPFLSLISSRFLFWGKFLSPWVLERFRVFANGIVKFLHDKRLVMSQGVLNMLSFIFSNLTIYISFRAFGIEVNILDTALLTIIFVLSSLWVVLSVSFGPMEMLFGYLSTVRGLPFGAGVMVCGLIRLIHYILCGGLTLIYSKRSSSHN